MEPHVRKKKKGTFNAFYIYFSGLISKILSKKIQNLKKEILYNQIFKLLNPDIFWGLRTLINFLCTFIALENVCMGLPGVYGCHTNNPFTKELRCTLKSMFWRVFSH